MISNGLWSPSPERLSWAENEVHIWRACLNQSSSTVQFLLNLLTEDERQRANSFYAQKDRERFVIGRGILRDILSRYLIEIPPGHIRLAYNRYGKPMLSVAMGDESLRFNVAHSHEIALYAITPGREVGLDIELIHEDLEILEIANRFFAPGEVLTLRNLPPNLRTAAFFCCWTRKEAFIKALGEGLSYPLDQFAVSIVPGEPAELLQTLRDPADTSRWSLVNIDTDAGYVAALAAKGSAPKLRCWQHSIHLKDV